MMAIMKLERLGAFLGFVVGGANRGCEAAQNCAENKFQHNIQL